MKKMFLVMSVVFVFIVFAACGGDSEPTGNNEGTNGQTGTEGTGGTQTAGPSEGTNNEVEFSVHPPRDMGGRTIQIASWFPILPDVFFEEPDPATSLNYHIDRRIYENARRIERQFNVNFARDIVLPFDDLLPVLTSHVMAGDTLADMVFLPGVAQLSAVLGDLIVPVSSFAPAGSDILGAQSYVAPRMELDGEIWSFDRNTLDANTWMFGVNLDVINNTGAPNPVDLYNAGEWTWDAMLDVMRRATSATAGTFGVSGPPGEILRQMIASNDGAMVTEDLEYGFGLPRSLEALEFASQIFTEGLWHYNPANPSDTGDFQRHFYSWQDGSSAMWLMVPWALGDDPIPFNWDAVPFPTGPSNYTGATWFSGIREAMTIPRHVRNPEDVFIIFEEIAAWPWLELDLIEEEHPFGGWRTTFPTEETVQRVARNSGNVRFDMGGDIDGFIDGNYAGYAWILGAFASHMWNETATIAETVEAERPARQEMIDNFFRR